MPNLWFLLELYALFYENVPQNVRKTETVKLQLNDNNSIYSSNLKNQNKQENIIQCETNKAITQVYVEKY